MKESRNKSNRKARLIMKEWDSGGQEAESKKNERIQNNNRKYKIKLLKD